MADPARPATNLISGNVAGASVQAETIHGGVHFHAAAALSAEPPAVAPPEDWSVLPELPAQIVSLLHAQIRIAEELPYRLPGARRPSLATVYVRQDVTSGSEAQPAEQTRPLPVLDSKGQLINVPYPPIARLSVRPPARSMRDALDSEDHMLVTGGPGQGKSTLSLRLAAETALRWQHASHTAPLREPVVPLRLTARELAARLELPFSEALAETVRGEYGALLAQPLRPDDLAGRVAGCRWLLLVDGLDEVADAARRDKLVAVLGTWASDAYRVVLTTRPIEGATLAPFQRIGAARYELLPFDEEAFRLFAENWFASDCGDAKRFIRQIRDAHLDELVRVPLLATIAAIIFEKHADRPLPDNQYELYETYLGHMRSAHALPPSPFDDQCDQLLEHLGRVRLEADTSLIEAAYSWLAGHHPELARVSDWRARLVGHLGEIGPFQVRNGDLKFLHHSFAEHLAATAKARELPAEFDATHQQFVTLLHSAEPEERGRYARRVLLHHARLYPAQADQLIRYLQGGRPQQHLLAARLLAWHIPAGSGVVDVLLATAWAWAATTQHPSGEILRQISRAAHHPGLVEWLRGMMRDTAMPWPSRVDAAVALATRLDTGDRVEAVAALRTVVSDTTIKAQTRLNAAEGLSECGADERGAAVSGLRSILASPTATAAQYSDAAVVLAGLGDEAKAGAVEALTELLDDPAAPDIDLVMAAAGLVEIGVEFHERCAAEFRKVLERRSWSSIGVEKAALGLASLGPDLIAEAAAALERRVADRSLHHFVRFRAASVLSQLGSQHRVRAGELVPNLAAEAIGSAFGSADIASALAGCGPDFHEPAAALARTVLESPVADAADLLSVGRTLVNLGPTRRIDAVHVLDLACSHPQASSMTRMSALGLLFALGDPHRKAAVEQLRLAMSDPELPASAQYEAAFELSQVGPEFHTVTITELRRLVAPPSPVRVRVRAWRQLTRLCPDLESEASTTALVLLGEAGWEAPYNQASFSTANTTNPDELANSVTAALHDQNRSSSRRAEFGTDLLLMGRQYHEAAIRGLAELLQDGEVPDGEMVVIGRYACDAGREPRKRMADAFREVVFSPQSSPRRVCAAAEAMNAIDALADPAVLAKLNLIAADASADAATRCDAMLLLVRNKIAEPAEATALICRLHAELQPYIWEKSFRECVVASGGFEPVIKALPAAGQVLNALRQRLAANTAEAHPAAAAELVAELRSQATDPFLRADLRSSAMTLLARIDPRTSGEATDFLRTTMTDERRPIADRCDAAYELGTFGQSAGDEARPTLLRLAGMSSLTPRERGEALGLLRNFGPEDPVTRRVRLALAREPAASGEVRATAARDLPDSGGREIARMLVFDYLISPRDWSENVNRWRDRPLTTEAEQVVLDRLSAPETTPAERVTAAKALSGFSPGHEREAIRRLETLTGGHSVGRRARIELTALSPEWHHRCLADACAVLADSARDGRDRAHAGLTVAELTSELPAQVRIHLEELLADRRIAGGIRLRMLYALRWLDEVRAVRDNPGELPIIRRSAANWLCSYERQDRAAAAGFLHEVATDPRCHPRLRWWAADDLAELGARGHELGSAALDAITADRGLPTTVQRDAARALGLQRPDLRGSLLDLLRGFGRTRDPLLRLQALEAIQVFEADESALGFLAMAHDHDLAPSVRCRGAWGATEHREHREAAAIVAREIAHDDRVAPRIRLSAARLLALASELCRGEAREIIRNLR
ncbi:NACHT domain-containing protein [Amycolatopsis sp. NPDC049252]|uniref:NACHT domain-containing protein n=1 Tax=Amycolatopsis sp. NPDC049252 TaxID=3363933 RepID=UPI00371026EC